MSFQGCYPLTSSIIGHQDRAWHVAWNPTQPLLASCSSDKCVRIYHYSTVGGSLEEPRFQLAASIPTGHKRTVRSVAWSPSGTSLATASFDSTVAVWERTHNDDDDYGSSSLTGEWECVSTLEGHESECKSVAYSYNGALLASCSRDKSVWVWEGAFCQNITQNSASRLKAEMLYGRLIVQ